jgi:hypothetical protein
MENNENEFTPGRKIKLIIYGAFLLAFLVYYTIMLVLGPARKSDEIKTRFGVQQDSGNMFDERFYTDSVYINLLKERAFLQSRISMAATDSVYMTMNFADSTANLEISGVLVHSARIKDIKVSRILRSGNEYLISSMLAAPMTIVSDIATIRKEPLMIKMAPRDTSEYKPDIIPDTSDYEPVNYILEMDNGIRIFIYQNTDTIRSDKRSLFFFDFRNRLKYTLSSLKSIARFRVPEYHPFIRIRLPKADAKILYRALPRNGQIAVYL